MSAAKMIVLLLMFPLQTLGYSSEVKKFLEVCADSKNCQSSASLMTTVRESFIFDVCNSAHGNVDTACYHSVKRALILEAELPVAYLKNECFVSNKSTRICKDIRKLCGQHPKSSSCSKIIPEKWALFYDSFLKKCKASENHCKNTAKGISSTIKIDQITEICKIKGAGVKRACYYIIKTTLGNKTTVDDWKSLCDQSEWPLYKKNKVNKRFCETVPAVCGDSPIERSFCDELEKTIAWNCSTKIAGSQLLLHGHHRAIDERTAKENRKDTKIPNLGRYVFLAVVAIMTLVAVLYYRRKIVFRRCYSKKKPEDCETKEKGIEARRIKPHHTKDSLDEELKAMRELAGINWDDEKPVEPSNLRLPAKK